MNLTDCSRATAACPNTAATCECVWVCGRGRTRLCCQLHRHNDQAFQIEVLRNDRLYGTYRFADRGAATGFADRLRATFEANGWMAA